MHIVKGDTRNFRDYAIFKVVKANLPQSLWQKYVTKYQPQIDFEETVAGVVEADDITGLLVQLMFDDRGNEIYTNGIDDIAIDNACKLLLLNPNIRQAFHASGFRPKLSRTYVKGLIVRYHGPIQLVKAEVPTEAIEVA